MTVRPPVQILGGMPRSLPSAAVQPTGAPANTTLPSTDGSAADARRPSSAAETLLDGATILARARGIAAVLREEADECEQSRQLTPRAVEALRSTGAFRMPMPRAWGGPEVDLVTQVEVIESLADAYGSAGWCASIGGVGGYVTAALDDDVARVLYPALDAVTAGWVMPGGRLRPVDDGYRLSGRWQFGSGCTHADVMLSGAVVVDADGEPVATPDGVPETRLVVLPAEQFDILDTWHTTGLAGTGSHDYTIHDAFVPAAQTFQWGDGSATERSTPGPASSWSASWACPSASLGPRWLPPSRCWSTRS
jgi:indole-3-acetate monooxygenase